MNKRKLIVIVNNIRSRENVGSIFRTADAANVSEIILCGITPYPPHEKISKTALGAEESVKWSYTKVAWRKIEELKKSGFTIISLEKNEESKNIFDIKLDSENIVLVIGNEVSGVEGSVLSRSDMIVEIPMYGTKESLNVSVAFGIAVYALLNK